MPGSGATKPINQRHCELVVSLEPCDSVSLAGTVRTVGFGGWKGGPSGDTTPRGKAMAGRKSALFTTSRPYLPRPMDVAKYLLKEWRQHPTRVAVGVLALSETDHTHFMRTVATFSQDETVNFDTEPLIDQVKNSGAAKFVLWITHPSGDPSPLPTDNPRLAESLRDSSSAHGCNMCDVVTIGYNAFHSETIERGFREPA